MEDKLKIPIHNRTQNPKAPTVRGHLPPLGLIWHHVAMPKCSWLSPKGVRAQERTHGGLRNGEVGVPQAPHSTFSLYRLPLKYPVYSQNLGKGGQEREDPSLPTLTTA